MVDATGTFSDRVVSLAIVSAQSVRPGVLNVPAEGNLFEKTLLSSLCGSCHFPLVTFH